MTKTKHTRRMDNERRRASAKAREEPHTPAWITRVGRSIKGMFRKGK